MREYRCEAAGGWLRYHDLPGDDLPILFIHGLGCASSLDYPAVASAIPLASHRRLLVDLLGSGYSDKPGDFDYSVSSHASSLAGIVESLGIDACAVFGHSMGGAIAIELAQKLGHRAQALVIGEGNLDAGGGTFSRKIAAFTELEYSTGGHARIIRESAIGGNRLWAMGLSSASPIAIHREARSLVAGGSPSWRETLYALACRRSFIFGERSLPDPDAETLADRDIRVLTVPEAGHSMAWENPGGLAAAIAEGIKGQSHSGP
jgi:haloalkane dehalogenase